MVKLSPFTSLEHRYLDVQALLTAFVNDPDPALIPQSLFLPAYPTPMSLFNSLKKDCQTQLAHHSAWLSFLRDRVWSKISYEVDMIPSDDALLRHWKRSCWVISVWRQSTPLDRNGWNFDQNVLLIEWDSDENIALIKKECACIVKQDALQDTASVKRATVLVDLAVSASAAATCPKE